MGVMSGSACKCTCLYSIYSNIRVYTVYTQIFVLICNAYMYSDSRRVPTSTFFALRIVYVGVVSVKMNYEYMHVRAGG